MSMTPSKTEVTQNLHGSIYFKVHNASYNYHCHAPVSKEAKKANPVWTIWRETISSGDLTCPTDGTKPTPDGNVSTDPASLTYWSTT